MTYRSRDIERIVADFTAGVEDEPGEPAPAPDLQSPAPRPMILPMSDVTRDELDAKLALAEARTETRFVELGGKIDRLAEIASDAKVAAVNTAGAARASTLAIILTIIGATLAAAALTYAGQANTLAAFQAGLAALTTVHH